MSQPSRRDVVIAAPAVAAAFLARPREAERTIPWLDRPPPVPPEMAEGQGTSMNLLDWEKLDSWITPTSKFFRAHHSKTPKVDASDWKLEIGGLVEKPVALTLEGIRKLPKRESVVTIECSGNNGFDWFDGGVGNAKWGGTDLLRILLEARPAKTAVEVVFHGVDGDEYSVPYIDGVGGKVTDFAMKMPFARSLPVSDAMLCMLAYEMNGEPLPAEHGFPLRLIAPGWYGIANVKWLKRIEVIDTRFEGPYMSQRYVTVREVPDAKGGTTWTRTSVGRGRLKSIPARVTVQDGRHRIRGAAWGPSFAAVEVRIDDGPWQAATVHEGIDAEHAWKFWSLEWKDARPGEHRITSRAIGLGGVVQPAADDAMIAGKKTYWESNGQITRRIRIG